MQPQHISCTLPFICPWLLSILSMENCSLSMYALERKGDVVANKLLYISGHWTGRSLEQRETTFSTHDYYDIPEAQRTEAQKEEVTVHQKTFETELLTWLDSSFRDLNSHNFWRTRNYVDLGI